jgi:hypothetical protein
MPAVDRRPDWATSDVDIDPPNNREVWRSTPDKSAHCAAPAPALRPEQAFARE